MENSNHQRVINADGILKGKLMEAKHLYVYHFNQFPSSQYRYGIDGEKSFNEFKKLYADKIVDVHQYQWFYSEKKRFSFDTTIVILNNEIIVEFRKNYCQVFHNNRQDAFVAEIIALVNRFKERQRREPAEINLIVQNSYGMYLKEMEIKRTKLDLDLWYEDDFKAVDDIIRKRLNQKKDKGIVLLHGLPGTGKTTYLRYLIGKIKKRVLFLSPNVAGNLMNPDFIDLLIDNPNTVLIIEDAENIIMDRRTNSSSAVSNLLNISDGLLADFLNVQIICTFNSSLTMIDNALMRKGRLIAKYEFGKLSAAKAQKLSNHLGFDKCIEVPMTVAEITNQHEQNFETKQVQILGFRREEIVQN